jgi:hypothetical protein
LAHFAVNHPSRKFAQRAKILMDCSTDGKSSSHFLIRGIREIRGFNSSSIGDKMADRRFFKWVPP